MNCVSKDLLAILACPKCKSPVAETGEAVECTNPNCRLSYPVREGIPIMLVDEATQTRDK